MINETLMSFEEISAYNLRTLYQKYGYSPYEMGKFEEYELYVRNKDFLVSDRVITFNDTNGKLMALKPDVTLSIIKNGEDAQNTKQKVFYNENVYRVSETTHHFKEIMQTGLECIGDIDIYDIYETICLAAESLSVFSKEFCIEISNLSFVSDVIASVCNDADFAPKVINCIAQKNAHDLKIICNNYCLSEADYKKLSCLITVYGDRESVVSKLEKIFDLPIISELKLLSNMLDNSKYSEKIKFDFSVVNDMNYYNGFVYKGFIDGISSGVLAGGRYDNMMKKMNRKSGAVGFAVYLDKIENLFRDNNKQSVDYLLIYDEFVNPLNIATAVKGYIDKGFSVSTQKSIPEKLKYKEIIDLRKAER